jgi:hypothetical protein
VVVTPNADSRRQWASSVIFGGLSHSLLVFLMVVMVVIGVFDVCKNWRER